MDIWDKLFIIGTSTMVFFVISVIGQVVNLKKRQTTNIFLYFFLIFGLSSGGLYGLNSGILTIVDYSIYQNIVDVLFCIYLFVFEFKWRKSFC